MKLQRRLSNGMWHDDDRTDRLIALILAREPVMAKFEKRTQLTDRQQVLDYLATGKSLSYDTDWNAFVRDADAQSHPKPAPRKEDYPDGRKLNCGHTVYNQSEVMSASIGSSCSACYDRMSD